MLLPLIREAGVSPTENRTPLFHIEYNQVRDI